MILSLYPLEMFPFLAFILRGIVTNKWNPETRINRLQNVVGYFIVSKRGQGIDQGMEKYICRFTVCLRDAQGNAVRSRT